MPQTGYEEGTEPVTSPLLLSMVVEAAAKLPGAIESYITSQLKWVARDFFRRSTSWRKLLGPYTITAASPFQLLDPEDDTTQTILVLSVNRGRYPMANIGSGAMRLSVTGNVNYPDVYYTDPPDTIHLLPEFTNDVEDIYAEVAVIPTYETADFIEQWALDQFYEALMSGLYARMYSEIDKPYSSASMAAYHTRKYNSEISAAKVLGQKNYTTTEHKWAFPRWDR